MNFLSLKKIRFEQMEIQKHQQNHKTTKQKWNNFWNKNTKIKDIND